MQVELALKYPKCPWKSAQAAALVRGIINEVQCTLAASPNSGSSIELKTGRRGTELHLPLRLRRTDAGARRHRQAETVRVYTGRRTHQWPSCTKCCTRLYM